MKKITLFIICIAFCLKGIAQNAETTTPRSKIPVLNGHFFPSSTAMRTSFITTHLHADIGFGATSNLKIPGIIIDDIEIFDFEGSIVFAEFGVEYQQRFTPWLAMFLSAKLSGRVGADLSTIVADGVNSITGGNIGWLMRIYHNDKFNLSAVAKVNTANGTFINVEQYLREIINNDPFPSVTKTVPAMSVGTGIRGAYAFNEMYGLQFLMNVSYGEALTRQKTEAFFSGGFLADVDFMPRKNVPVGLALGYTFSSAPQVVMNSEHVSSLITGKIGYTGSKEFELGALFTYYSVRLDSIESKPFVSKVVLLLKFYF